MFSLDDRNLRRALANIYKALILVTLGSLFAFAPLKSARQLANAKPIAATIVEVPEVGSNSKILWLDPKGVVRGQGESFRLAYEE